MRRPIACSLDASDARSQIDEWRELLAGAVESVARDGNTVRMQLRAEGDTAALIALAQREVACCPFFRFTVEIDTDGVAFTATVPEDAMTILDGFTDLATQ
jgi:hypothetical protein